MDARTARTMAAFGTYQGARWTHANLRDLLGLSAAAARRTLDTLLASGSVRRVRRGVYAVTEAGARRLTAVAG